MVSTLEQAMNPLKPNERIIYTYEAKKNGTNTTLTKRGVFVNKVRHSRKYWVLLHRRQKAVVMFDGNKTETRVLYHKLNRPIKQKMIHQDFDC